MMINRLNGFLESRETIYGNNQNITDTPVLNIRENFEPEFTGFILANP